MRNLLFPLVLFILASCSSIKHISSTTGIDDPAIKTEYCIELLDSSGKVKVHSHITGKVYIVPVEKIHEAIDFDNL